MGLLVNTSATSQKCSAPISLAVTAAEADVHAVLIQCDIAHEPSQNIIIANEDFNILEAFGLLDKDANVHDMAKHLAAHLQAANQVIFGTVIIKRLQTLIYWVKDCIKINQPLNAASFMPATISFANAEKKFCKELKNKLTPDGEPLRYIVQNSTPSITFAMTEQQRVFQIPLTGSAYNIYSATMFRKFKLFLINRPGWAWIKSFDVSENGQAAFTAWTDHYNGQGKLSKRISLAKSQLKTLFYKHEPCFPFEKFSEKITCIFHILSKDSKEGLTDQQKVVKLLDGINVSNTQLQAAKTIISNQYSHN
eukprot:1814159-Ditylum_brightwellii.AAC.1